MIDAVLILDKPSGMTSHDVVNRVRRITGERSVGHLGTLDPMATGVLPLVLGRYTRLAQFFKEGAKTYEGTIIFGYATDTYDAEGEAQGEMREVQPTLEELEQLLPRLRGRIQQMPPVYSAKKINGVPAYKLARRDKPVELKPVEVEVRHFEITGVDGSQASFVAEVSAGTYIRSLAHDLGQMLGCGAHLMSLRRTQAGEFTIQEAITLEQLAEQCEGNGFENADHQSSLSEYALSDVANRRKAASGPSFSWIHPRRILTHFPSITAPAEVVSAIRNGRAVNLPEFSDAPLVKVFASQNVLLAIMQRVAGTLFQPKVVLYSSNDTLPADDRRPVRAATGE